MYTLDFQPYMNFIAIMIRRLFQVVVESSSAALEYGDLTVEEGSPVNPDLHFDSQLMHLYVMTERKVSFFTYILSFAIVKLFKNLIIEDFFNF